MQLESHPGYPGSRPLSLRRAWALPALILLAGSICLAAPGDERIQLLKSMSLEELSEIEVSIASKRSERLEEIPAAVYVITSEEIRRSGMTEVPELLRMVPGFHVARIDSARWAISARGYNRRFADKLLVLLDGRNVYSELFSGVYWDAQLIPVENIERIEIYRGPGGAIWGANAVTGVVNIVTRKASDAGPMVSLRAGTEGGYDAMMRYGGKAGPRTNYSFFVKGSAREGQQFADGSDAPADLEVGRIGLRVDVSEVGGGELSLHGDYYDDNFTELVAPAGTFDSDAEGHSLVANWNRSTDSRSSTELLLTYDRIERNGITDGDLRSNFELEYRQYRVVGRHTLNWGAGYRRVDDDLDELNRPGLFFVPAENTVDVISGYLQDQIELKPESLDLIAGVRVENNDYTGTEILPTIRLLWRPDERSTVWGAYSRAVRTPGRFVTGARFMNPVAEFVGNPSLDEEKFTTWELGYRVQLKQRGAVDITAFYSTADDLTTVEPISFVPLIVTFGNNNEGRTAGLELSGTWDAREHWRLRGAYSYLDFDEEIDPAASFGGRFSGVFPTHQAQLLSRWSWADRFETDLAVFYVGSLPFTVVPGTDAPSYVRVDARFGWNPTSQLLVSLGVHNLLDDHHLEYVDEGGTPPTEVAREVYALLRWQF